MPQQRRDDRYRSSLLQPDRDAGLISLMAENGAAGTVFHVLEHVPEQCEDMYTILIDGRAVVTFEVPRMVGPLVAQAFNISSFADYRNDIGQGKWRIRLDRAAEETRALLAK